MAFALAALPVVPAHGIPRFNFDARAPQCLTGTLPGGAQYSIAAPAGWSPAQDELIVFAPGYRFPADADTISAPDPLASGPLRALGLAVATLSYRKSGLAVKEGVQDLEELFGFLAADPLSCGYARPARAWLVGGSEGALIATLVSERQATLPQPFIDGTLAACGPIGDFRSQLNYIADFRVVFNALFPGVIPGSAVFIPPDVAAAWETLYAPRIRALLHSRASEIEQLLRVTGAAYDPDDAASIETTVLTLLRYNVLGGADVLSTLGGRHFDNNERVYAGSGDAVVDEYINAQAERFTADPVALAELATYYETTGRTAMSLQGGTNVPLVTLHTRGDPLVPQFHQELFRAKAAATGSESTQLHIPIERFGHCTFEPGEILGAFFAIRLRR